MHNDCFKLALALVAASGKPQRKRRDTIRGDVGMLDAIQISVALWAMIVCGGIKLAQIVQFLL